MYSIRKALPEDMETVSRLFRKTIRTVNACDYDPLQLKAWSARYEDINWWQDRIRNDYFIVAEDQSRILGFCSARSSGILDLLYVHKDYQGNGVGTALMSHIDNYFSGLTVREITSEVSITARPFFEKMGFNHTCRQVKCVEGVEMLNFIMKKKVERAKF